MGKRVNSENGVTLITLVVTIIVLIILAGVSIASLVGDDGILNEANDAKNESEIASEEEEITLAFHRVKLRKLDDGESSKVTPAELEAELLSKGVDISGVEYASGNVELKVIMNNGNEHIINQDGKIVGIYGTDKNVTPTNQQYFSFTTDDTTNTATITGIAEGFKGMKAYYSATGTSYASVIVDSNGEYITDIAIPYEVTNAGKTYTVTSIVDNAFMVGGNVDMLYFVNLEKGFTSIKIPNTVTSIGQGAFAGNDELTSIVIPSSVTSIGASAFEECSKLKSVSISGNLTAIESRTFSNCTSLVNVKIPSTVTNIGNNAFSDCTGLTSVTIPSSVTSIGSFAFSDCTGLTNIKIPSSLTSIGEFAFSNCSKLTSIAIPNRVESIGREAFWDCDSLTTVTIPSSVTSMEAYIFNDCDKLTDIYCEVESKPSGWDSSWNTYCNATVHWKSVQRYSSASTIPTDTKYFSFKCDSDTKTATVLGINPAYGDMTAYYNGTYMNYYTAIKDGSTYITDVVIPYEVTEGGITYTVTSIGDYAFIGPNRTYEIKNGITRIELPNTITSIGKYAFQEYTALTDIIIPSSVTNIEQCAFIYCTGLTSITIPRSVTTIGGSVFNNCTNLQYIYCKFDEIPSTWSSGWNSGCSATVVMGQ